MSDVKVPRHVFDDIVLELQNAIDDIDNIRSLGVTLVRAKRLLDECDPELTPVEHFANAKKELEKGKP